MNDVETARKLNEERITAAQRYMLRLVRDASAGYQLHKLTERAECWWKVTVLGEHVMDPDIVYLDDSLLKPAIPCYMYVGENQRCGSEGTHHLRISCTRCGRKDWVFACTRHRMMLRRGLLYCYTVCKDTRAVLYEIS